MAGFGAPQPEQLEFDLRQAITLSLSTEGIFRGDSSGIGVGRILTRSNVSEFF
jgi:hypothetical protein